MSLGKKQLFTVCLMAAFSITMAQRQYKPSSVLSNGIFYKIGISAPGIYKLDIPFLNGLGLNTSNIPSSAIRLFGNGGTMLGEANNASWTDDLTENAIQVVDGNDGV
ncbi:MAG: hypothetical protein EOO04_36965, partial [Chitinophagaceae bacterium]